MKLRANRIKDYEEWLTSARTAVNEKSICRITVAILYGIQIRESRLIAFELVELCLRKNKTVVVFRLT